MKNKLASDVIDALGGTTVVAEFLGCRNSAVSNMRVRGIPPLTLKLLKVSFKKKLAELGDIDGAASYSFRG